MPKSEIITLQLGNYANFVGSHFWNFQDELLGRSSSGEDSSAQQFNFDVLYRVGETAKGDPTYTPRTVVFDLKGSLGSLPCQDDPYSSSSSEFPPVVTWSGETATYVSEPVPKNSFLQALDAEAEESASPESSLAAQGPEDACQASGECGDDEVDLDEDDPMMEAAKGLEDSVEYWTDYLKAQLHIRSIYQLPGKWQDTAVFDGFGDGADVLASEDMREEALDRVRFFLEECDHLQGFHVLAEDQGGFGAVTSALLTHLRDDCPRLPVVLFSLRPPEVDAAFQADPAGEKRRWLSRGLAASSLTSVASVYVPVGSRSVASAFQPSLHIRAGCRFHTSSVYAAAIEGATTPYRLHPTPPEGAAESAQGRMSLDEYVQLLRCRGGAPLAALAASMPAAAVPQHAVDARMEQRGGPHAGASRGDCAGALSRSLVSLTDGVAACTSTPLVRIMSLRCQPSRFGPMKPLEGSQTANPEQWHFPSRISCGA
ncbi:hypothetical protein CYMTET_28542 [Cymbomonas tetramitiformis]|uniref:Uncharacterized protein n=1 Tax=Cymbomonas tetramitiformis TaxID=36881 RepID=A0AAE0FML5_9CHLO|nr:hypothetical protein CYMTET_28542 [Cymbomonas tetramitiformis]